MTELLIAVFSLCVIGFMAYVCWSLCAVKKALHATLAIRNTITVSTDHSLASRIAGFAASSIVGR